MSSSNGNGHNPKPRNVLRGELKVCCTDPMTGFFAVRRGAVDTATLRPQGFKILLEILARHRLAVTEVPFTFGARATGASKATAAQGWQFLRQLLELRLDTARTAAQ